MSYTIVIQNKILSKILSLLSFVIHIKVKNESTSPSLPYILLNKFSGLNAVLSTIYFKRFYTVTIFMKQLTNISILKPFKHFAAQNLSLKLVIGWGALSPVCLSFLLIPTKSSPGLSRTADRAYFSPLILPHVAIFQLKK